MRKNPFQDMVKITNTDRTSMKKAGDKPAKVEEVKKFERSEKTEKKQEIRVLRRDDKVDARTEPEIDRYTKEEKERGSRYGLWFVAGISIIFFLFALSFLFARAVITISPKIQDFNLKENLSATKDSNTDALPFDIVVLGGEDSKVLQATETKEVALKAKGTVLIYNTFSSAGQKLDIDTRLEGSNGKLYKTAKAVVVPGTSKDGNPGSVEVGIYGVEAGEAYNSNPLDFKIFGFKGTPKYSKFYARSKGTITGGFIGSAPVVSDTDKETAFSELKTSLKEKLFQKASGQIPSGFVLFKDAVFLNVDAENAEFASKDGLPVSVKGTMYGFLFNEEKLARKIAEDNIPKYDQSPIYIPNVKDLVFSLSDKDVIFSDVRTINFNLSGNAKFVWKFDADKLISELTSKSKKDFDSILSQYPNVDSAELSLSPFWLRSFPSKAKDIKVNVNYPQ